MSALVTQGILLDGRYLLQTRLGQGTFGEVWEAEDRRLMGRLVAIKILLAGSTDDAAEQRFQQEIRALSLVSHPNVVHISDAGAWEGRRFLVVELVRGRLLSAWLAGHSAAQLPPLGAVRRLFGRCCAGVAAAHAQGVVHRDLKPDNVMIPDGDELQVKVLDFGLASLTSHRITRDALRLGTELYMAPEQFLGNVKAVGPPTDVFALAVMFLEMLTLDAYGPDSRLWWSISWLGEVDVAAHKASVRPEIPAALWAVIGRALHKDPATRPADAAALASAIESTFQAAEIAPSPTPSDPPPARGTLPSGFTPLPPGAQAAALPAGVPPAGASVSGRTPFRRPAVFYKPPPQEVDEPPPTPVQLEPDLASLPRDERCRICILRGDLGKAIDTLEETPGESPKLAAQASLWIGDLLAEQGSTWEAARAYNRAKFLSPAFALRISSREADLSCAPEAVPRRIVQLVETSKRLRGDDGQADLLFRAARLGRRHSLSEGSSLLHVAYRLDPGHQDAPLYEAWMIRDGDEDTLGHTQVTCLEDRSHEVAAELLPKMLLPWRTIHPDAGRCRRLRALVDSLRR
jgi:serine/threonine-protein kinase